MEEGHDNRGNLIATVLRSTDGILSGPVAFLVFSSESSLRTPLVVIVMLGIFGCGDGPLSGIVLWSLEVKTDVK